MSKQSDKKQSDKKQSDKKQSDKKQGDKKEEEEVNSFPESFPKIIRDFVKDLSTTFPEFSHLWNQWKNIGCENLGGVQELWKYTTSVFPERFFDILYQNEDIFLSGGESENKKVNVFFLPNVDFSILFQCADITDTIKESIWKYLQLILFTMMDTIRNKEAFGETSNIFAGMDEKELQGKLGEVFRGMGDFFHDQQPEEESSTEPNAIPNPESIFDGLKTLFDGKIGKLAKELTEELEDEFKELLGSDNVEPTSMQDAIKKLMRNPQKMIQLVKKMSDKLTSKMSSGDIQQEDIKNELSEFMKQMKDMGGPNSTQFQEMFKNMTKGMGLGKNAKMDTNAYAQMEKKMTLREGMRIRLDKRKAQAQQKLASEQQQQHTKNCVVHGGESKEDIDNIMNSLGLHDEPPHKQKQQKQNKAKK